MVALKMPSRLRSLFKSKSNVCQAEQHSGWFESWLGFEYECLDACLLRCRAPLACSGPKTRGMQSGESLCGQQMSYEATKYCLREDVGIWELTKYFVAVACIRRQSKHAHIPSNYHEALSWQLSQMDRADAQYNQLKSRQLLHNITKNRTWNGLNRCVTLKVTQSHQKWRDFVDHISLSNSVCNNVTSYIVREILTLVQCTWLYVTLRSPSISFDATVEITYHIRFPISM